LAAVNKKREYKINAGWSRQPPPVLMGKNETFKRREVKNGKT